MSAHTPGHLTPTETIELIRILEEQSVFEPASAALESEVATQPFDFEGKLRERANRLSREWEIQPLLASAHRALRRTALLTGLVFACLGAFSCLQAFPASGHTVNFFWLVLVLLGTHGLMFLVWVIGGVWQLNPSDRGIPAGWRVILKRGWHLTGWDRDERRHLFYLAWLKVLFRDRAGFWRLSLLSHGIWLAFLCGGLVFTLLMLAARQYDFIWETTLLSESAFQQLTQGLGALPAALGFTVPTPEMVALSHPGSETFPDGARIAWASLLLGTMLIYGIGVRGLSLALACWQLRRHRSRALLPLSQPYYVALRQRLAPAHIQLGIVDADSGIHQTPAASTATPDSIPPPRAALWVGLEIGAAEGWPPTDWQEARKLGVINDRDSRTHILNALNDQRERPLVIVSDVQRTADRGLLRQLKDLKATRQSQAVWLALIDTHAQDVHSTPTIERLSGWYTLAEQIGLPTSHLFLLGAPEQN